MKWSEKIFNCRIVCVPVTLCWLGVDGSSSSSSSDNDKNDNALIADDAADAAVVDNIGWSRRTLQRIAHDACPQPLLARHWRALFERCASLRRALLSAVAVDVDGLRAARFIARHASRKTYRISALSAVADAGRRQKINNSILMHANSLFCPWLLTFVAKKNILQ